MKGVIPIILGLAAALTVLLSTAAQDSTEAAYQDGLSPDSQTAVETAREEAGTAENRNAEVPPTWYSPPLTPDDLPPYDGEPYVTVNGNVPYFTAEDLTTESFERYSPLDSLGRCGTAFANVSRETMPTEQRGPIGDVRPSGWHTVRYDDLIDGRYLYNRCHLIAYRLAGENANTRNLITGTRYLNTTGMLPFEDQVGDYIEATRNHVLYRVTPLYEGENLVASGVLIEAYSVEDGGDGVSFNVYCYNVQPGIAIDYRTGDSHIVETTVTRSLGFSGGNSRTEDASAVMTAEATYILNRNTKKFHYSDCPSVSDMSEKKKLPSSQDRETIIALGYVPCKRCNP